MLSRKLIRADLNLLVALQALLEERNVTHAAERLYITQPALSKTLQKLRDLFDDPLFSRSAYGLIPTPRALELEEQLPNVLRQLNHLIGGADFVPAEYGGDFRLAMPESLSAWVMPQLLSAIEEHAPNITLHVEDPGQQFVEDLTSGRLDFAFHLAKDYPGSIYVDVLGQAEMSCLMRADHPLANYKTISQKDFLDYPHVRLYLARATKEDVGIVDELLAELGQRRRIMMETTHLTACLDTLQATDAMLVASKSIIDMSGSDKLIAKPMPKSLQGESIEFGLVYHRRVMGHAAHQWLKDLIVSTLTRNG